MNTQQTQSSVGSTNGSAPTYDLFLGNNDYDTTGMSVSDALFDLEFELNTVQRAALLLHHGISKAEALAAIDGLRELVAQSDLPNNGNEPQPQKTKQL